MKKVKTKSQKSGSYHLLEIRMAMLTWIASAKRQISLQGGYVKNCARMTKNTTTASLRLLTLIMTLSNSSPSFAV